MCVHARDSTVQGMMVEGPTCAWLGPRKYGPIINPNLIVPKEFNFKVRIERTIFAPPSEPAPPRLIGRRTNTARNRSRPPTASFLSAIPEQSSTHPEMPNHSASINLSSRRGGHEPDIQLAKLWEKTVEQYIKEARLDDDEKAELKKHNSPEEAFDLVKKGWIQHVDKRKWKNHTTIQQTVGQIIGIFDVVDAALGFAADVLCLPFDLEVNPRHFLP